MSGTALLGRLRPIALLGPLFLLPPARADTVITTNFRIPIFGVLVLLPSGHGTPDLPGIGGGPPTPGKSGMKDAEIMRQNARFRSSWEPGGDLITLTARVAGATVINGVIGHCRPSLRVLLVGEIRVVTQWHSRDQIGNLNVLSRTHGTLLFAPEMEETRKQWPPSQASGLYPDIIHSTCSVPDFFVTELPFSSSVFSFGWTVRRVGTCFRCVCDAAHKAKFYR
jgi:hypothetical protein